MGAHAVVLPAKYFGYGSSGGPGHRTTISENRSGIESRLIRWEQARRRYEIQQIDSLADLVEAQNFVLARRGAAHSFLIKDLTDFSTDSSSIGTSAVTATDVNLGTGDGTETEFQLVKRYAAGEVYEHSRRIEKPIEGTLLVAVNSVTQTETTHYTVSYETGAVSFVSPPTSGHTVSAGFQFYVPVRFGEDVDDWMAASYSAFDANELSLPMVEDKNASPVPELYNGGGSSTMGDISGTFQLEFRHGKFIKAPAVGGAAVLRLPDVTSLIGTGAVTPGDYYRIQNTGAGTFTLHEFWPSSWRALPIAPTLGTGISCDVWLDNGGTWNRR